MRAKFRSRVRVIAIAIALLALVSVGKLYSVQVIHGDEYRERATDQQVAPRAHELSRGTIYFTDKSGSHISAATIQSGFTVVINPSKLSDPQETLSEVRRVVPEIDEEAFMAAAAHTESTYKEVARRITEAQGAQLSKLGISGVKVFRERWRFYPGGTLAAHEVGFIGYADDGETLTGRYGLERTYNDVLMRPESGFNVNFIAELFSNVRMRLSPGARDAGGDVVTSIEPTVEKYLHDALLEYQAEWHTKQVGGIILDPKTGAVLAMASLPTFDPNDVRGADPNALGNPLVSSVYEFGSTMKPITMAAALDSGAVTRTSTYYDSGTRTIDEKTISNFDGRARGTVPMQEILNQSLNIGIAHIVEKMGTDATREYFERFGITEETGIDLPSEGTPLIQNLNSPRSVEYVTAGYGQGIALTPIAMARALATLANKGEVPQPHVGVEIRYPGGVVRELGWAPPRRALSEESAHAVTEMLVTVVDTALQGGKKKIPELSIAAKTGTAQIADPVYGGYYRDRYLHSFFGYFPAYDARFLVFLYAVEPTGAQYASETWTGPFFKIAKFLMTYYDVPFDRAPKTPAP